LQPDNGMQWTRLAVSVVTIPVATARFDSCELGAKA